MVESAESFESSDDEDYIGSLHILKKQISRQERELDRLKSSVTYRMGEHVTNASILLEVFFHHVSNTCRQKTRD